MIVQVFLLFAALSLLAVGGGSAIIPELQRQAVEQLGWLTHQQFVDFYALTQMTPGPSMLVVALIGYQAAGGGGAVAATLGMFGPSTTLVILARRVWHRLQASPLRSLLQAASKPLAVGTTTASALVVARTTNHHLGLWVVSAVAAAAVASRRLGILPTMVLAGLSGLILTKIS